MSSSHVLRELLNVAGRLALALGLLGSSAFTAGIASAATITTAGPLQVTQSTSGAAVIGKLLTYTMSVTNTTSTIASGILLGATPPASATVITPPLGPGGNPDLCARGGKGTFDCSMGNLAPGAMATVTYTIQVPNVTGSLTNSVVAQGCTALATVPPAGVTCATAGGLFVTSATSLLSVPVLTTAPAVSVPSAPTAVSATAGNGSATVTWTAPLSDGGSPITGYTVTSNASISVAVAAPATSMTFTGLTNGTPVTFTVTATNAEGVGPASAASASVTPVAPITAPAAPTGVSATAGNASATVTWLAPATGGSPITSYTITSGTGTSVTIAAPATSTTLTGLSNGTPVSFTVVATNAVGNSPASVASNSVTPVAPATVPAAPTGVSVTAGNASAAVSWTAPAATGGSPITSYTLTSSPAGGSVTVAAPATSAVVSGLTNGTAYTFTVIASNAVGNSPASTASNTVTPVAPATVPAAPTAVIATAGNAQASVSWTAPAATGGSAITSYTVTSSPAGGIITVTAPATSAIVSGLTNGTAYAFTVIATNAVGSSPSSAPSNSVTPVAPAAAAPMQTLTAPQRLVDTRAAGGPIAAGTSRCLGAAGTAGIPADASSVVLNVAAVGYAGIGYLTLYPNGQAVPATSTLNFDPHEYAIANGAITKVGSGGQVCVNAGVSASDVILDVTGFVSGAGVASVAMLPSPQRLVDTRQGGGVVAAGTSRCFGIGGLGGVPADAAAVILNVTAVGYAGLGYLTLYPNGQTVPATSTLNFDPHEYAIANGAIIKLGTSGQVCVNAGVSASEVIVDATGYVSSAGLAQVPTLAAPQRLVDTRLSGGPIAAGTTSCFAVAGQGGIPANATAVILNVTAVGYTAMGWLRLYPNGQAEPGTSTLNFDPSEYAIADGAIIKLGTGGQVCVSAGYGASNVILDATGYLAP